MKVLLRDFEAAGLDAKEQILRRMAEETQKAFPDVKVEVEVKQDYGNMKEVLDRHPVVVENAKEATRRAGLTPIMKSIRGGTDGAALSLRGLPCPNLFTGGRNFHGKLEFNSRRGLEKTTETLVHLSRSLPKRGNSSRNSAVQSATSGALVNLDAMEYTQRFSVLNRRIGKVNSCGHEQCPSSKS